MSLSAADFVDHVWPLVFGVASVASALLASSHAVLHKRDVRAAIAWVGIIWLVPIGGAVLYVFFGINRIARRATTLRARHERLAPLPRTFECPVELVDRSLGGDRSHLCALAQTIGSLTGAALLRGNLVEPLVGGDAAYAAMLAGIQSAERTICLCTYIFNKDPLGVRFAQALADAAARGVEVRVLIDDVGARYAWPPIDAALREAGVPTARFLETRLPGYWAYSNLRNHRKIMVVDGRIGFAGGLNIQHACLTRENPAYPIHDVHFQIEGPVVSHLSQVFVDDWAFSTGELLRGEAWLPSLEARGSVLARGVAAGPDERFDRLLLALLAAVSCAKHSIRIVTPYFLPDGALVIALNLAALRGVTVDVVLPAKNNLRFVEWASMATLPQILEGGCRVWLQPPPFDHSKLLIVDETWVYLGSSNWDIRSLRLNFEFDVECYDVPLAERLAQMVDRAIRISRRLTLDDCRRRTLPIRLRDGVARLFSPYL